jgi:hypothetical protein
VFEHHQRRQQEGGRVRQVLAGDVRRAAVHGLEHRGLVAEIRTRYHAEATDEPGTEVGHDVPV